MVVGITLTLIETSSEEKKIGEPHWKKKKIDCNLFGGKKKFIVTSLEEKKNYWNLFGERKKNYLFILLIVVNLIGGKEKKTLIELNQKC